jgi:tRNA(Arg) A34 adenosine deaminase TadA
MKEYMHEAINEAACSLREGNHGFGCVIVKDNRIMVKTHDLEETDKDPTSHAEINAIRAASRILGKDLRGCILVSTHEPCPMCSASILWSGIEHLAYGYSIEESISQGRRRINLTCEEMFRRAGKNITVTKGVLHDRCSILYRSDVREEIKRLKNVTDEKLDQYNMESLTKRIDWFKTFSPSFTFITGNPIMSAYNLLLCRFNTVSSEVPIVRSDSNSITFHSMNFCPTLEACRILGLDTRHVCRRYNEDSTDTLIKQIDKRLKFTRNYEKLRPHTDYCEEMITLETEF